jgi:peroxiredoxin
MMIHLEGQQAAAFSSKGSDGKRRCLADYKGKTVVLFFYPRARACREALQFLARNQACS